jgi:putative hydrolase of the HAD superfamily
VRGPRGERPLSLPPALLVDYGEVISRPQPARCLAQMAALLELDPPTFIERYWEHRLAYDSGLDARSYWSAVAAHAVENGAVLEQLVDLDIASWSDLNGDTLEVLAEVHRRGSSLTLLSNAPHELADALDHQPALRDFDRLLFSARLGVTKPDAAVFRAALETMSRDGDEVLFIDDRPANVEGARAAGLHALLFTSAETMRRDLLG